MILPLLTATLFNLNLTPLYRAIAQVESDRGATSKNIYQLRTIFIDDVNRITGHNPQYKLDSRYDQIDSETMMWYYWRHYGARYEKLTGKPVTYEVLARMHNGGPDGWKKDSTLVYWSRVKKAMEESKHDNAK